MNQMQSCYAKLKLNLASLLAATVAFLPATSQAEEDAVFSVNIVGFQKQQLPEPGKFDLVASPFVVGSNSLRDIFGTNSLFGSSSAGTADRIRIWDPINQNYVNVGVGPGGKFYMQTPQGAWVSPLQEVDDAVPLTEGFWIVSSPSSPQEREITFVGNVVLDESASHELVAGFNILSYPFSSTVGIQDLQFFESGATGDGSAGNADRLRVWDRQSQSYINFGLGPNGKWYLQTSQGAWVSPLVESTHVFEPGESFFYYAVNPTTWTLQNPYRAALID